MLLLAMVFCIWLLGRELFSHLFPYFCLTELNIIITRAQEFPTVIVELPIFFFLQTLSVFDLYILIICH